jgi:hypothetical protein
MHKRDWTGPRIDFAAERYQTVVIIIGCIIIEIPSRRQNSERTGKQRDQGIGISGRKVRHANLKAGGEPVFGIWKSAKYDDVLKIRLKLRLAAKPAYGLPRSSTEIIHRQKAPMVENLYVMCAWA